MEQTTVPYNLSQAAEDYKRIEEALIFLSRNFSHQPTLEEMAASVALSEYHFQRLFSRWVGISPKRFLQYLTKEYAKKLLERSYDLLSTAHAAGLSGPGRLHDLFVAAEAVSPGEYKQAGAGLEIAYGFHPSPFGDSLVAATGRGICNLSFAQPGGRDQALAALRSRWPRAALAHDPARTGPLAEAAFASLYGGRESRVGASAIRPLSIFLRGTNFQIKVWEALLRIPPGAVVSYEGLAAAIGQPRAARAVGGALAHNPVPWLIPCHRVIRRLGDFGNYQYGPARKLAMLGWEMAWSERVAGSEAESAGMAAAGMVHSAA